MSKIMKKTMSILLAVIMIVAYMPATAFADSSYDFSNVQLNWRNNGAGYYEYSTLKANLWYLCQHYYDDKLISSAYVDGDEDGYGVWQTIPAGKMKEPGKYKLVLSVFSNYNDLEEYEGGNISKKPLYQTSVTKDYSTAKRLQIPSDLKWNSDKKTVSWKVVDNATAYLVDAKKIYKDGHIEDITFDSFPCELGDDGVSVKNGRVYVNLSDFIVSYSQAPITYSSNVKDIVFDVIAVPDNSGEYFVSKTSEKCYFSGQNSNDNTNNDDPIIDIDPGEVPSDDDVLPLYIAIAGDGDYYTGMGRPIGMGIQDIEFYLDEELSKKITSGIEFPSGGGSFIKNASGSFDWDNTNAIPGEYQIIYNESGKKHVANLYVFEKPDSDENTDEKRSQLYIRIGGSLRAYTGISRPIGESVNDIEFYLDEGFSKKITSGITFPSGGGIFKKNFSGSFDWDNTNATPGEYEILYVEDGKEYSIVFDLFDDSDESEGEDSTEISLNDCTISSVKKEYTYTGKAIKLAVQIVDPDGYELVEGQDYKITYKNNVAVGKGTATIKGIGNYTDSISVTMTIKPKTPSLVSLSKGAAKFTAKWKKVLNVTGYQIRYSKSSGMTNAKTLTIKSTDTKKTVSGLDGNKKYYVQVRAYKTINGKKYYSAWSTKKSITVGPKYSSTTVKNAYMKYLKNGIKKDKYGALFKEDLYYALHDMNNDGIKELVVCCDSGAKKICSYENGKVKSISLTSMWGSYLTMKDCEDLVFVESHGYVAYFQLHFDGKKITEIQRCLVWNDGSSSDEEIEKFEKLEKRISKPLKLVKYV